MYGVADHAFHQAPSGSLRVVDEPFGGKQDDVVNHAPASLSIRIQPGIGRSCVRSTRRALRRSNQTVATSWISMREASGRHWRPLRSELAMTARRCRFHFGDGRRQDRRRSGEGRGAIPDGQRFPKLIGLRMFDHKRAAGRGAAAAGELAVDQFAELGRVEKLAFPVIEAVRDALLSAIRELRVARPKPMGGMLHGSVENREPAGRTRHADYATATLRFRRVASINAPRPIMPAETGSGTAKVTLVSTNVSSA